MKSISIRILALMLALLTVFSLLTACSGNDVTDKNKDNKKETEDNTENEESESEDQESESSFDTTIDTESESGTDSESESESENNASDAEGAITIFANGAYSAKFIKSDLATAFDTNVYNQVRELFKGKTSLNPSMETDFTPKNQEKYDGPAILVGDTNYPETEAVMKTLKDGQAIAKLVGNKFVIVYASSEAATKLINTLKTTLSKKATAEEIKIDETWNATATVSTTHSENVNFKDSGLTKSVNLANLGLGTQYSAGQESKTYVKTGANKTVFSTICSNIEKAGATRYTGNSIGNNLFSTYVTQTQIIHVMFFPNKSEVRTAVDVRGTGTSGYALPGLSTENKYTKKNNSTLTLCEIENADWPGGMCMIFKLADGRFFVVDAGIGGRDNNGSSSGWVYASLAKYADDPKNIKVAAWLITHVHSDHAGALYDMVIGTYKKGSSTHTVMPKEAKQYIKIDKLIYNQPATMNGYASWMETIINGFGIKNVVKAHPGQVFFFADLTLTIYGSQDLFVERRSSVSNNNEDSVVSMASFNGKKILILGDAYPIANQALSTIYKEQLKADVVQTAHHGYDDTKANLVYEYCKADIVLWPVAKGEMSRENVKNNNTNKALKSATYQYAPHGGNLVLDHNWKKTIVPTSEILSLIPTCPCGCGKKSSYVPKA